MRAHGGARAGTLGALADQSCESPSSMDVYMLRVTGGEARLHVDQNCSFRQNLAYTLANSNRSEQLADSSAPNASWVRFAGLEVHHSASTITSCGR
jgi:hypothetical protein